jgi:hypothetical protein
VGFQRTLTLATKHGEQARPLSRPREKGCITRAARLTPRGLDDARNPTNVSHPEPRHSPG